MRLQIQITCFHKKKNNCVTLVLQTLSLIAFKNNMRLNPPFAKMSDALVWGSCRYKSSCYSPIQHSLSSTLSPIPSHHAFGIASPAFIISLQLNSKQIIIFYSVDCCCPSGLWLPRRACSPSKACDGWSDALQQPLLPLQRLPQRDGQPQPAEERPPRC